MLVGGLRMAVRAVRRTHEALPQTHGCQAVQVPPLFALLLPLGPPRPSHEETPVRLMRSSSRLPRTDGLSDPL
ncbi:UNVERIFIED_CONTAM: hypothetical protein GTU68_007444 [Idotea baltica]|nr:hypothetical protein [Idotea baltica]